MSREQRSPDDGSAPTAYRPRVALIQSICPHYRVPLFTSLAGDWDLCVFHGSGDRSGSWRNAENPRGFAARRLATLKLDLRRAHPYLRLSWFPTLVFHLARFKPQVVVSEGLTSFLNCLTGYLYARAAGVPMVIWDGGRRTGKSMPLARRLLEPINRFILTRADACIGYGRVAAEHFKSVGVAESRIVVAHNTIDVEAIFEERKALLAEPGLVAELRRSLGIRSEKVVLYVGAIEKRKRLESLLATVFDLKALGEEPVLLVVGDGAYLDELKQGVERMGIGKTHLIGRVTDGVGRYFLSADLFVLPGPGGLSINQAMAYGLPVVVWGGDGTEDDLVLDGVTGYVVSGERELAQRTTELLGNDALRSRMSANALAHIATFTLRRTSEEFSRALRAVVGPVQPPELTLPARKRSA